MLHDPRYAFRQLAKSPGFTAVAVLTLALGIGLSTTIFNAVNPLLFRALPFRDPGSLVYLNESNPQQGFARRSVSYADYTHWRQETRVFADIGIWDTTNFTLADSDNPEHVDAAQVSATLFEILGLQPVLGRGFTVTEDQPGAAPVALIGAGLWQRRFGADPAVLGRTLSLNGKTHTIVGVMPARARFPENEELWVPLVVANPEKTHGAFAFKVVARLKPGVTLAQVETDLASIQARIAQETPGTNTHVGAVVRPIAAGFFQNDVRAMGWTLLGAVAFVLAVAGANVASLFLTRALGRQHEFAIRAALGAGRWRTIRQLLVESLLLGGIGGTLGLLLSLWGMDLVRKLIPIEIPYWVDFSFDGRVLAFAVGVSLLTSLAFGLAPAWHVSRADVRTALNATTRGSTGGRPQQRLRGFFVVSEVALATLLLCGTGLMIRSLLNLRRTDPGFNPARVATLQLDLASLATSTAEARNAFFESFTARLGAVPGVQAVAACSCLPLSGNVNYQGFAVDGRPLPQPGQKPSGNLRVVTPGYFATMEIPLVAGRDFTNADSATSPKVIVIDASFARQYFPGENPLGKHLRWNPTDPASAREIVGIAADVKHYGLDQEGRSGFYVPYAQEARRTMSVVLRTASDRPLGLLPSVRQTLREIDPTLPLFGTQSMADLVGESFWINRFLSRLLIAFSGLALALAAVGIASVVGYAVTQRTREIGIRMALGAQAADVLRLLLGQGMRLVLTGLVVGLVASLGLARVLTSQLYGVSWLDPVAPFASAGIFGAVALLACWLPARRATRINPVEALRAE
jgi:putative ABC transport system permease protein